MQVGDEWVEECRYPTVDMCCGKEANVAAGKSVQDWAEDKARGGREEDRQHRVS